MQPTQPQYTITPDDTKRQETIAAAWRAYHGELVKPLERMPDQPDDNVMSNRCQPIVDRGVDFLFGKSLEISLDENAPAEAQKYLDDLWGRQEKRIPLLQKLAMSGAIAGNAYLRIMPNVDPTMTRLIVVDPSTVFVQTEPQDCETVMLYCIEYCMTEQQNGKDIAVYYREEIQRIDPDNNAMNEEVDTDATWIIQHWTRVGERGQWLSAGDPILWPYEFSPLFGCQNKTYPHSYYGIPDLTPDLIGVNNSLNLVQSNVNRTTKLYGHPIIYATGVGTSTIDIKPGRITGLPTSESKLQAVQYVSDLSNALNFAENLRSDIDEQSSVPGVATGRIKDLPRGTMSGNAIELLFMPLLMLNEKKRCLYGSLLIDLSNALLEIGGYSDDINIVLAWQNPLPHDDLPAVQASIGKKQIGISNTTLQRELGYDPEIELQQSQTEDAVTLQNFTKGQGLPPPPQAETTPPVSVPPSQFIGGN